MRILITRFPYFSQWGGTEFQTMTLVDRLSAKGFVFSFLGSCKTLQPEFKKRLLIQQSVWFGKEPVTFWTAFFFPLLIPYAILIMWPLLAYQKYSKGIEAVYMLSLTEKLLLTPVAHWLGLKIFWIEHVTLEPWLIKNPYKLLYKRWSKHVNIICVSEYIKTQLLNMGTRDENIHVIYNGIHLGKLHEDITHIDKRTSEIRSNSLKQEEIRLAKERESDEAKHGFCVGTVARLAPEKGHLYLIRALAVAKQFIPDIHLTMIGDGPEKQRLVWLAKELGIYDRITFLGYKDDFAKRMLSYDVFVLPSKKESFGIVLLYAGALFLPTIATNVGGIPEVVEHGKTGILVEPENSEMLAQAIINMYNHPEWREEYGLEARQRIEERFSEEKMVESYEKVLSGLTDA